VRRRLARPNGGSTSTRSRRTQEAHNTGVFLVAQLSCARVFGFAERLTMWRCCEKFSPLQYALSSSLLPCCRFSSHFKAPFSSHCHGNGGGAAAGARNEKLRVFIVAGEPSGDLIGSRLMASLRRLSPRPLQFAGVGGYDGAFLARPHARDHLFWLAVSAFFCLFC
jgi:hypothetical protein